MPATLVWGKGFEFVTNTLPSGDSYVEVFGIDGGSEPISWSSVREIQDLAGRFGVNKDHWPVYPDCDVDSEVPLDEVQGLSVKLKADFQQIPHDLVENDHWLRILSRLLQEGNSFFIMI